jgi:ATP:ADP antiporter, AAA family
MVENRTQEVMRVALLFTFFLFVIAVFWTLKPFRTASVVKAFGIEWYPITKHGIVLVAPAIVAFYSYLTTRFTISGLVYFFGGIFFAGHLFFWTLISFTDWSFVHLVFFYHVDAYITVMVALFWTYLNDSFEVSGAKKRYGFIGAGGLVGGIGGSFISGWAAAELGANIILVGAGLMIPMFIIVAVLSRMPAAPGSRIAKEGPACCGQDKGKKQVITEGFTEVFKSGYLLSIVAIVGIYELLSAVVDFQFTDYLAAMFDTAADMAGYHGKVLFVGQLFSLLVQVLLTTVIHRKYGIMHGLLFLPAVFALGATGFLLVPGLAIISFTIGGEAAFSYSINQASKEILYVPLDDVTRYKSKAFIDVFVLRAAKLAGGAIVLGYILWLAPLGVGRGFLSAVVLTGVCAWLAAVIYAGSAFKQKAAVAQATA